MVIIVAEKIMNCVTKHFKVVDEEIKSVKEYIKKRI